MRRRSPTLRAAAPAADADAWRGYAARLYAAPQALLTMATYCGCTYCGYLLWLLTMDELTMAVLTMDELTMAVLTMDELTMAVLTMDVLTMATYYGCTWCRSYRTAAPALCESTWVTT
eukprot:scaffold22443_cov62-Phaeocystis_antarctica.AAC.8